MNGWTTNRLEMFTELGWILEGLPFVSIMPHLLFKGVLVLELPGQPGWWLPRAQPSMSSVHLQGSSVPHHRLRVAPSLLCEFPSPLVKEIIIPESTERKRLQSPVVYMNDFERSLEVNYSPLP